MSSTSTPQTPTVIKVILYWDDITVSWDHTVDRIIACFGLPGGKYTTEVSQVGDWMSFNFSDPKDALVAKLMVGGV